MSESQESLSAMLRLLRNAFLMCAAATVPFGASFAQGSAHLDQVRSWLEQGVNSALLTQEQANIMLEALSIDSEATEVFIQAQVSEGMNLSAAAKAAVAETYLNRRNAPADRAGAGMTANATDTQGKFVSSLNVIDGEIIITYGNEAHSNIAGKVLVITPFATTDQPRESLVWQCGLSSYGEERGAIAIGAETSNRLTTVAAQYLPRACRE